VINSMAYAADVFASCRGQKVNTYFEQERAGIHSSTLEAFHIGYNPPWPALAQPVNRLRGLLVIGLVESDGLSPYRDHAVFPHRTADGTTTNLIFRSIDPESKRRYRVLPPRESLAQPPGRIEAPILYGLPGTHYQDEVAIVEGPIDVLRCYQAGIHALALCGNYLSAEDFLALLCRTRCTTLMLDWDGEGSKQMFHLCLLYQRLAQTEPVGALYVTQGPPGQDPGGMRDGDLRNVYRERVSCDAFIDKWRDLGTDPEDPRQAFLLQRMIGRYRKWKTSRSL